MTFLSLLVGIHGGIDNTTFSEISNWHRDYYYYCEYVNDASNEELTGKIFLKYIFNCFFFICFFYLYLCTLCVDHDLK